MRSLESQAYLFDLDGTLIDTAPDIHTAANDALVAFGHEPIDLALTRRFVGRGGRVLLERVVKEQGASHLPKQRIDAMYQRFLTAYEAGVARLSKPYDDVVETLTSLRARGFPLAVITNKLEGLSEKLLRTIHMRDFFECLVGFDSLAEKKPHPLPVLHACERLGVRVADALFVGDSATDVATARAAGCPIVCVNYGYSGDTPPEALGADRLISNFSELL